MRLNLCAYRTKHISRSLGALGRIVTNVERLETPQMMYNLTVDTAHTFFVGEGEWLVHNTNPNCLIHFFDSRQLQEKFSSHAADFGITRNWNKTNASRFQDALLDHVVSPDTHLLEGTYRNTMSVRHYYNPTTGNNVMFDLDGNFISGWKLSPQQAQHLLTHGNLQ